MKISNVISAYDFRWPVDYGFRLYGSMKISSITINNELPFVRIFKKDFKKNASNGYNNIVNQDGGWSLRCTSMIDSNKE